MSTAIERLKANHITALLTVEDGASIYRVDKTDEEGETYEDIDHQA